MKKQKTWSMIWTDELKELESSIQRVRELHAREEDAESYEICDYCCMLYPCPTIKALDGEQ